MMNVKRELVLCFLSNMPDDVVLYFFVDRFMQISVIVRYHNVRIMVYCLVERRTGRKER